MHNIFVRAKARCRAQGLPNKVLVGYFGVSEEGHRTTKDALEWSLEEGVQGHVWTTGTTT